MSNPLDVYLDLKNMKKRMCSLCGADFMLPDYKPTMLTRFMYFLIISFYGNTVYTVWYYWGTFRLEILQCMILSSMAIQGTTKLYIAVAHSVGLRSLFDFIESLYVENSKGNSRNKQSLESCVRQSLFLAKLGRAMFLASAICLASYPIFAYLYQGTIEMMFTVIVPGMDPSTIKCYVFSLSLEYFQMVFGVTGNMGGDLGLFILIMHYVAQVELLSNAFAELNERIHCNSNSRETTLFLRNILLRHQDMTRYIDRVDRLYIMPFFFQVSSNAFSMSLCLLSIFVFPDWIAAYGTLMYSFTQLFLYCIMGTVVETMNDKIIVMIFSCDWYALGINDQKLIMLMLRKAQRPTTLRVGGFAPLNVATGTQVIKTIYSHFIMLLNVLK